MMDEDEFIKSIVKIFRACADLGKNYPPLEREFEKRIKSIYQEMKRSDIEFNLREFETEEDYHFMYELVKKNIRPEINVLVDELPPLDNYLKDYTRNDFKSYIIELESKAVGFVHITKSGEIGYYLEQEHQKKGIAIRAVKQMLKLNPMKIYHATVSLQNKSSEGVMAKAGFIPKGLIYEFIESPSSC